MRKMRRLTIDVPGFLKDYHDAVASGMTVREFCEVTGLHNNTLHGRIETLAKRGVILPLLNGMRRKTRMGRRLGLTKPVVVEAVAVEALPPAPLPAPEPTPAPALGLFQICVGCGF